MFKRKKTTTLPVGLNDQYRVAFIVDDRVVEIINCNARFAAILTSGPTAVAFKSDLEDASFVKLGWKYEDGIFKEPSAPDNIECNDLSHDHSGEKNNICKVHGIDHSVVGF
jgi:hypothetical protein